MAEVIWAQPTLNDLDAIADYIALDNPEAGAASFLPIVWQDYNRSALPPYTAF